MHPKVQQKYKDEAPELLEEYQRKLPANETNLNTFWQQVSQSKEPVTKQIYKLVRLKNKGEEYFYYHIKYTSKDVLKNKIEAMEYDKGYYEDPQFRFNYQQDPYTGTQKRTVTEVEGTERVYELSWPKDFTEELQDLVTDNVDLLLMATGRKYGGFSLIDFKEKSFDELVTLGRFGTLNPVMIEAVKKTAKQRPS